MNRFSYYSQISRRQQGIAMIEFALVFPMMVMLLIGFVEFGRVLYQENQLTGAILSGARYLAREPEALTASCTPGPSWSTARATAVNIVAYSGGGAGPLRLPGLDADGAVVFTAHAQNVTGSTACVIAGDARAPFDALFGESVVPLLNLEVIQLNAQAEERYIGE
ncbi:MAG: TadE/TadG family type IV pilus assembly protein [Pseudohongiellaceae bacterium]